MSLGATACLRNWIIDIYLLSSSNNLFESIPPRYVTGDKPCRHKSQTVTNPVNVEYVRAVKEEKISFAFVFI